MLNLIIIFELLENPNGWRQDKLYFVFCGFHSSNYYSFINCKIRN